MEHNRDLKAAGRGTIDTRGPAGPSFRPGRAGDRPGLDRFPARIARSMVGREARRAHGERMADNETTTVWLNDIHDSVAKTK